MEIKFTVEFEDEHDADLCKLIGETPLDGEYDVSIPAKYEVCNHCQGEGTQVNPNIDGNGLSREDFAEDPDFAEDYTSGLYDIQCLSCQGIRVKLVPDEKDANPKLLEMYYENLEADAEQAASEREYDY